MRTTNPSPLRSTEVTAASRTVTVSYCCSSARAAVRNCAGATPSLVTTYLETHVLGHWEDMQLLEPARDGAGRRRYDAEHALRCRAHDVGTCPRFKAAVSDLLDGSSDSFRSGLVAEQHIDRHTGHHDDA